MTELQFNRIKTSIMNALRIIAFIIIFIVLLLYDLQVGECISILYTPTKYFSFMLFPLIILILFLLWFYFQEKYQHYKLETEKSKILANIPDTEWIEVNFVYNNRIDNDLHYHCFSYARIKKAYGERIYIRLYLKNSLRKIYNNKKYLSYEIDLDEAMDIFDLSKFS